MADRRTRWRQRDPRRLQSLAVAGCAAVTATWPSSLRHHPTPPLSERATRSFFKRASASTLRFPDGFLADVEAHVERLRREHLPSD